MPDKIKRPIVILASLAALALGGAGLAGATSGGSGSGGTTQASPAADNHADRETNDGAAASAQLGGDQHDSAGDADGSAHAEASE